MASDDIVNLNIDPDSLLFRTWYPSVIEIKNLFHQRKYKSCAARCKEMLSSAAHPLHRTFLHFYSALCYESLGLVAHMYSENKIGFLEKSRAEFDMALDSLSVLLPVSVGSPVGSGDSPDAVLQIVKRYQFPSPLTGSDTSTVSPCESTFSNHNNHNTSHDFVVVEDGGGGRGLQHHNHSRASSISSFNVLMKPSVDKTPNFDAYTPRSDLLFGQSAELSDDPKNSQPTKPIYNDFLTTPNVDSSVTARVQKPATNSINHKVRLSQSLSSTHCLVENLIPSPLFNRNREMNVNGLLIDTPSKPPITRKTLTHNQVEDQNNNTQTKSKNSTTNQEHTTTTNPNPNQNKPLPPLPFNHLPKFTRHGTRHILIPNPRKSAIQTLVAKFEGRILQSRSPITPRFEMISHTLAIKPDVQPFQLSIETHLESITTRIHHVRTAQCERDLRRLEIGRSASFWSFESVGM